MYWSDVYCGFTVEIIVANQNNWRRELCVKFLLCFFAVEGQQNTAILETFDLAINIFD